jgi:hypothetical protein
VELIWAILAAAGKVVTVEALVGSAIGGIVGNRIDAGFVALCEGTIGTLKRKDAIVNGTLEQAVRKSLLLAQMSIAQDCLETLVANDSVRSYRSVEVYIQFPNEIAWLKKSLTAWQGELKGGAAVSGELGNLAEVEMLLGGVGSSADGVMGLVRDRLWSSIPADAPQIYVTRSKQATDGLFDRLGMCFAAEMQQNSAVREIFETQILVQISSGLKEQSLMIQDVTIVAVETLRRMEERFDRLENMLGNSPGKAVAPSLIVMGGVRLPPNPFKPLSGAVDDAGLFFPREGLVSRVFELLNSGSSVALIGAAESGKSSLLREIGRCTASRLNVPRQVVRLDLSQVFGDNDFYTYLCSEVGIAECREFALGRALKNLRILLMLDEADVMSWEGFTNPLRKQLRGLASDEGQNSPLKLVVAAREPLDQVFLDSGVVSPFENICLQEMMEPWDEKMIRSFVAHRLEGIAVQFSEGEILEVIRESGGSPGKVMRACFELYRQRQNPL